MPLFPRPAAADGGVRQTQTAAAAAAAFFPPSQSSQNPLSLLQARVKDLETSFRSWLDRQPLPVEAAVVTATNALQGAAIGGLMGTFSPTFPTDPNAAAGLDIQAVASLKQAQAVAGGPLVQARNFAVITGANAGISCVMKRIRGVEDVQTSVVAGFGSGALFSLVSGLGGPNQVANAVTSGVAFAIFQGGFFMLGQKFSKPQLPAAEDVLYSRARSMLISLGLQNYEKNFKQGLLTDNTLPLLTDSALRDVKIPPGPRLLILDQVHRDPELTKGRK